MLRLLNVALTELRYRACRFTYLNWLLGDLPGELGIAIRGRYLPRYFAACGEGVRIFDGVRYRGVENLRVGHRVHVGVGSFLQATGGLELRDDVVLGPGVKIWTINHRFDDPQRPIAEQEFDQESVVIHDGCWLAANVFVMPGVVLAKGCVVSAGSVVGKKNYPAYAILAGNPARMIGTRVPAAARAAIDEPVLT